MTKKNINRMQVAQNRTLRIVLEKNTDTPTDDLIKEANVLSIYQMIVMARMIILKKILLTGKPKNLFNILEITKHQRSSTVRVELKKVPHRENPIM